MKLESIDHESKSSGNQESNKLHKLHSHDISNIGPGMFISELLLLQAPT